MNAALPEPSPRNILVVYYATEYPLRATIYDHLYSFRRHSRHRVFYLNIATRKLPPYFKKISFDLIVFHTILLGRWHRDLFWSTVAPIRALANLPATKVALPQDEFLNTDLLVEFVRDYGVQQIYSVAPPSEWPTIYAGIDVGRVQLHRVLTGYLEPETIKRIEQIAAQNPPRTIDIGYRAYRAEPWLGRFGWRKRQLAEVLSAEAPGWGLQVDISSRPQDTFLSDEWYHFLLRCKYAAGVEGGASLLDRDGSIKHASERYLASNPDAGFEEVEQACFPHVDGNLCLNALAPRHLEACATRTCQLLVEGDYNGILQPGKHYIEIHKDFSNLAEVLDLVRQDRLRDQMVANAYRDIVQSNKYTYQQFVDFVLSTALADAPTRDRSAEDDTAYRRALEDDRKSWQKVKRISAIVRRIPTNVRGVGRVTQWLRKIYLALR